eukprot:1155652-Pelagomonas_calceolata.AAC.6
MTSCPTPQPTIRVQGLVSKHDVMPHASANHTGPRTHFYNSPANCLRTPLPQMEWKHSALALDYLRMEATHPHFLCA